MGQLCFVDILVQGCWPRGAHFSCRKLVLNCIGSSLGKGQIDGSRDFMASQWVRTLGSALVLVKNASG
eukprot:6912945-Ditylum_brightwellii.AAC.1